MSAATAPPRRGGLARAVAVMASGTFVSRLLGLVSKSLLTLLLGASALNLAANAFDVANKMPNVIYALVAGGALNAVLVPQVVRADRDGERGREFLDRLFTMATLGLLGLTVLLTLAAGPLVELYTGGEWDAPERDLAVAFAVWCIPQLFFYGVYTLFGQLLNARGSFGPYTWAPVVNNVVAISGLVVFLALFGSQRLTDVSTWSPGMVALLAGSATAGVAAQALVLLVPLRRTGFSWRPRWGLRGAGFRAAGTVAGWTFAGIVVSQLVFLLVSQVAGDAQAVTKGTDEARLTASNTSWTLGFLLFMLPHGLLAVSLVTAVFTRVSAAAHEGRRDAVAATTAQQLRVLLVGMTLPAAGLALFGTAIVTLLFPSSAGDEAAVVGQVVRAMAVGLPFFSVLYLVQRVFYAFEDGRTPFVNTTVQSVVWAVGTVATPLLLPPTLWVPAVALSMSLGQVAALTVALVLLHRRTGGGLELRRWLWVLARLVVVLGVVSPLAVLAGRRAGGTEDPGQALVTLLVGGGVLVVGYVLGTLLLRVAETRQAVAAVTGRFARAGGRSSSGG